ncbi:hybrid sensor histidine kinase/response regulator [Hydrogenophaga sp. A37]|uniref:hybrid sensor histidine kinase/response regulator n=1 Tax=Hydrogenophaga sp. A37 TaxID=1945864 RepID=UPI0009847A5B|nr:hybrid sensor histidine kinase/response regulator [Hydrogenophaga sp. A37]OOG79488.1 hybrid sensor histidine kinase/response regulator [Hydrogenophaga sp. A37]
MKPDAAGLRHAALDAHAVLLVDDEPQALKWFARLYGDEFVVLTASGVTQALALLAQRGHEVAVLLTDYSMPGQDGVALLSAVRQEHPHVSRLLVSAFADKDVAMAAVNQGQVEAILEKPLDEAITRQALREALATSRQRTRDKALIERREATLRETLGFLAHEVTTPLATVSGYLTAMRDRHQEALACKPEVAFIGQRRPGEVKAMLDAALRRSDYAQSLVSSFVQTARDAYHADSSASLRASDLVQAVLDEYPFDEGESGWLSCDLERDFTLPGRRDLLYLVICTLVKNALMALRSAPPAQPRVHLVLNRASPAPGLPPQAVIQVIDNGPGIAPDVLQRLTHEPVTTRAASGGSGMGLVFCQRVMTSMGGTIEVRSGPDDGAVVNLYFPSIEERLNEEPT